MCRCSTTAITGARMRLPKGERNTDTPIAGAVAASLMRTVRIAGMHILRPRFGLR